MDLATIAKLMEMLQDSSLNELEVSENGMRIRLSKTAGRSGGSVIPASARSESPEAMAAAEIASLLALPEVEDSVETVVVAGLPGTFYRAPSPGAEPYAKEGDVIKEGQTLALIEAMKMLNPVEAPLGGRVGHILMEDGQPVTAGTPLITLIAD
ncbi:acetyl-CoA carboxylase, biotin carboxyl carrier protein [Rhizobium sp. ACO-34A]|nr:acetyl-CoA carboxylase biotin carboxyl carrier protein [Rhizobium sp. ACO-34A]ATN32818.1 acetyl-CoA carboxylase, biotin carboxyl carrier protein [Rhizobium sp. ACO-34A]